MANNLLATHILKIVEMYVDKYNMLIDEEFGLGKCDLQPLWDQVIGITMDSVDTPPLPPSPPPPPPSPPPPASPPPASPPPSSRTTTTPPGAPIKKKVFTGCPYVFTKGAKEGQMCGCKPNGNNTYCSRHKKYEGHTPKSKKVLPPLRRSIVSTKRKNTSKKKNQDVVLHKGPGGRLYHRPTGLVFGTDKVAIGTWLRADDNPTGVDEVIPLTDKDVDTAKKYMFAFRRDDQDISDTTRKVTRLLEPTEAKKLQQSLSHAIAATNAKAEDVADILCELQVRGSPSKLIREEVSDESEYEEDDLEEEED